MKRIKILGCLFLVLCLSIGGDVLYKKEDYSYYLVLGDYISKKQVLKDCLIL